MHISRKIVMGLFLFVAISASIAVFESFPFPPFIKPVNSQKIASTHLVSPSELQQSSLDMTVDGDRLLKDIEHLAFVRHSADERFQAREYIKEQLVLAGWDVEEYPFNSRESGTYFEGVNILATHSEQDADARTILLGAHYDTVENSPGADDNASGVATVLELARLLADIPMNPSLAIALFDLEEEGLVGSKAWTEAYVRNNEPRLNIEGAIILEMLGYACYEEGCQSYPQALPIAPPSNKGNFVAVISNRGQISFSDAFRAASDLADDPIQSFTLEIPLLGPITPDLLRSDHVPFWRHGIDAVMVTDTANFRNPHYHQQSDTPDTIDVDFLIQTSNLILRAIGRLIDFSSLG